MAFENPSREEIKKILESAGNIAVVGLSDKTDRTSYMVAQAMQSRGYRIIPVNPSVSGEILGEKTYGSLKEIHEPIDIVNVFRRSEFTPEVAKEAVEVGANVLWLQQGIANEQAAEIAGKAGLTVIMDRCIKVEEAITAPKRQAK
ncbi:CoA-binding protein [Paenibacillus sp. CAA11]|uniref:CoA-binding protein n=1 Tax=Paenibacillus sp. CAA11 TaxID=1532905 RepID=UPI000D3D877B|nr:CoA-binding protein [Paenibacillus sp. CAA11]AWB45199.1 CoA-binding protein [Paenibacillus sp. CAA11]